MTEEKDKIEKTNQATEEVFQELSAIEVEDRLAFSSAARCDVDISVS